MLWTKYIFKCLETPTNLLNTNKHIHKNQIQYRNFPGYQCVPVETNEWEFR
jgi:hypothetical protein